MTDEDLLQIATEFRQGMLDGNPSHMTCAMVSWPLADLLHAMYGVECECVETELGHSNHVWIRLADGRALDATADQFNHFASCDFPPVYLGQPAIIHKDGESLGALRPGAAPDSSVPAVLMPRHENGTSEIGAGEQTFEMVVYPEGYRTTAALLVGSFAIHRNEEVGEWKISHAATGLSLPGIYPETKQAALKAAEAMDAAADWSKVTRSAVPQKPCFGITREEMKMALQAGEAAMGHAAFGAATPA